MSDPAAQNGSVEPPLVTSIKDQKSKALLKPADRMQEIMRANKAMKEERKGLLDGRHEFLFTRVLSFYDTIFFGIN